MHVAYYVDEAGIILYMEDLDGNVTLNLKDAWRFNSRIEAYRAAAGAVGDSGFTYGTQSLRDEEEVNAN